MVVLKGWRDIDGPVYDKQGNIIITQDDFDRGLRTSFGVSLIKLGNASKTAGIFGADLLGKLKDKTVKGMGVAYDKTKELVKVDYSPVVNSIDRIYYLLCSKFGVNPVALPGEEKLAVVASAIHANFETPKEGIRLNSLEDEKHQKEETRKEKVDDAIIKLGDSLGGIKKTKGDDKDKKGGLWGLLTGGLGMLKNGAGTLAELFFGKTVMSGFSTLFKFGEVGLKVFPLLASGIGGLAKFFLGNKTASAAEDIANSIPDEINDKANKKTKKGDKANKKTKKGGKAGKGKVPDEVLERANSRDGVKSKKKGNFNRFKKTPTGFSKSSLLKAGLVAGAGSLASGLVDDDKIETVSNVVGGYMLAAIGSIVGGGMGAGLIVTAAAPVAVGAAAYGLYRWIKK